MCFVSSVNRLQQKSDQDFHFGGQVWYLIVAIPDLCTLTYFNFIKSRADNYMCKFAFEKAVEQLLNYKG